MSIGKEYIIVDGGGTIYVGKSGDGLKTLVYIHVNRFFMIDCPVQWCVVMEIFGLIPGLVNNDERHEAFPIRYFEYKYGAPDGVRSPIFMSQFISS